MKRDGSSILLAIEIMVDHQKFNREKQGKRQVRGRPL